MAKRNATRYPGVFYREAQRVGGRGTEKVYYVVFKKNGKLIEEKAGRQFVDDMTPAKAANIRGELIEGKRLTRKEIQEQEKAKKNIWTIDRLWEEYKRQKPGLKGLVQDENRYKKYIKPAFGSKEPKKLLPLDVDRVRLKMLKTKSPQTVKLTLALLRRICNFGVKKRLCDPLPFSIELPQVHNEKTEDLTPEQLTKLLEAIDTDIHPQAGPIMKMALFTGMRRGELFKLRWKDVNFEKGFILLNDPKGGPDQKIPLNDASRELLESYPRSKSPFVFPGRDGRQRTDIHRQVNKIRDTAGLPKDFRALHGLRHVYASMLASSGEVDMYVLQRLLTHKSPTMTQRYAHLRDEALKRASQVAGAIINSAMKADEKVIKLKEVKNLET
ncbi:MAG: site-specific integrase [Desulfobacteraceae bacterium]|nr:MAG: site-specific integrase [Desulfobacteraceae bacterium]